MDATFGYYPLRLDSDCGDFRITTRDDFVASVEAIESNPFIDGDWIYSPPKEVRNFGTNSTKVLP